MATEVRLEANLHPAQEAVWTSPARFRVVGCGRRFGKTHLATLEILHAVFDTPGGEFLWVAPNYETTDIGFEAVVDTIPPELVTVKRSRPYSITAANKARIKFMSADKDRVGTGWGFNGMVVDEAAFVKAKVWTSALRPTLTDRRGWALLIGTFDGENWFYEDYERGQDPDEPDYNSWRYPTLSNPYIDPEEVESARRNLPQAEFEQEYEANPLVYVGAVFAGHLVQEAIDRGRSEVWTPGLATEAGLDWGYTNPTVLEVCQITADDHVRWLDETLWYSRELNERCKEIALKCRKLGITRIYADAAGKDENITLAHTLKGLGLKTTVKPVPFNQFKGTGITSRRWHLERNRETIGRGCPVLAKDSKRYRYKENKTDEDRASEDVVKKDDHTIDACTALYATRFPKTAGRTD